MRSILLSTAALPCTSLRPSAHRRLGPRGPHLASPRPLLRSFSPVPRTISFAAPLSLPPSPAALSLAEAFAEEQRVVREEADARVRAQEAEVELLQARIEDMAEQAEEDEEEMAALEEDLARAIKRVEELGLRSAAMTIE
ncbi:unnamed protein product, partial [Closterium sp. NIES-53]